MEKENRQQLEELTEEQQRALEALLQGANMTAAAEAAGVHVSSVSKWISRKGVFANIYRQNKIRGVQQAVTDLQRSAGRAARALCEIAGDAQAPYNARLNAAKAILDYSINASFDDLLDRVEVLEKQIIPGGKDQPEKVADLSEYKQ